MKRLQLRRSHIRLLTPATLEAIAGGGITVSVTVTTVYPTLTVSATTTSIVVVDSPSNNCSRILEC